VEVTDPATGERVAKPTAGTSRSRAAWEAEGARAAARSRLKHDIDKIVGGASSFEAFAEELKRAGYGFRAGNVKYVSVTTPDGVKVRLDSLGGEYTEAAIRARVANGYYDAPKPPPARTVRRPQKQRWRVRGTYAPRKLSGLEKTYFKYLYLLGKRTPKRTPKARRMSQYMRGEVRRLQRTVEQANFLRRKKLAALPDLTMYEGAARDEIYRLTNERAPLYRARSAGADSAAARIEKINAELKLRRSELAMCKRVRDAAPKLEETLRRAEAFAEKDAPRPQSKDKNRKRKAGYTHER
jgi:hypothetical protein